VYPTNDDVTYQGFYENNKMADKEFQHDSAYLSDEDYAQTLADFSSQLFPLSADNQSDQFEIKNTRINIPVESKKIRTHQNKTTDAFLRNSSTLISTKGIFRNKSYETSGLNPVTLEGNRNKSKLGMMSNRDMVSNGDMVSNRDMISKRVTYRHVKESERGLKAFEKTSLMSAKNKVELGRYVDLPTTKDSEYKSASGGKYEKNGNRHQTTLNEEDDDVMEWEDGGRRPISADVHVTCATLLCLNGGYCVVDSLRGGFRCQCQLGSRGEHCERGKLAY